MYTSNELEALSVTFDSHMRQLEKDVMSDIIRRISINGEITRAADWQINRLIEMGVLREDIEKSIKHSLKMTDKEIEELFREAAESGYSRNDEIYKKAGIKNIPFEDNTVLQQLIAAVGKQTAEEMTNISQSLGFAVRNSDGSLSFKPIAEYYQDTLDNAIGGIANGVFDYNTAIKRAVSEMTKSGLRTVDYASGWSNRVDVAARRAIMTGFSQVTGKMNEQNAEKLHTDTFEVTWHSGARPSHQEWQGKWYTREELVSVCGLGTVTGLHGANCRHDYFPVIPGISVPTYTAEELEEMNRKENIPVEYNGKKYTKYEALQRQRKLETTMRAQRQQIHLLKVGNADEDDIIAARCRYRVTSQKYKRFSEAMELPEQRQRVTVDGLGNIGQGKWKTTGEKLAAQLPKGFDDTRKLGEKISATDLNSFVEKADEIGVKFHVTGKSRFGGFEDYRGDVKVLFEALEHIKNNQPLLTKVTGDDKITLKYKYIFDGSGKIDTGTFASSEGRTITLNKFMYDDSAWLAREYEKEVEKGRFVKGTTYKNIIDHELGHIIGKSKRNLYEKTAIVCKKRARLYYMYESEYIIEFISKYATANDKELFAEINSLLNSEFPDEAEEIFKEVGLL